MALKIFFSWQSDSPSKTNKSFIEDALEKAARSLIKDPELIEAIRSEEIEIDKDTEGVPGSPPIVETIFNKITQCTVFVPDLSIIGTTESGRKLPNPNVLIEYGWALSSVGTSRIIAVMNTAHFDPKPEELPFDMRHLRKPLSYNLSETASSEERAQAKTDLVKKFSMALRSILTTLPPEAAPSLPSFEEAQPKAKRSSFLQLGEALLTLQDDFGRHKPREIYLEDGPQAYLRLMPIYSAPQRLPVELKLLGKQGKLFPLGFATGGVDWGINEHGFAIFSPSHGSSNKTYQLVQLMNSGEIWAINDPFVDHEDRLGPLTPHAYEGDFVSALSQYREFAMSELKLNPPFKWIAGMSGIKGRALHYPPPRPGYFRVRKTGGLCVKNEIEVSGLIDGDSDIAEALKPFFESIYGHCGESRQSLTAT
jgi:hypothetical protein